MNLLSLEYRKQILSDIKSEENKQRKAKSFQEFEVYNDRLHQYVESYLISQLSRNTVKKMPVISSINISKRVVDQQVIYKNQPEREFHDISDDDKLAVESALSDMMYDTKLLKSNSYYKLQHQNLLQVVLKDGKLEMRVLLPHHYDVIPSVNDPEKADGYVISAFDRNDYSQFSSEKATSNNYITGTYFDNTNANIADREDYKESLERYVVWSVENNFIMDGNGNILSDDVENPIGVLPFVDVSGDKDFEYFVRRGSTDVDFTIQYNAAISDLANTVRMQNYSQAVVSGPSDMLPTEINVGPTTIIRLPIDQNNPVPTNFQFVSPSPDIGGSIAFIELLMANYLSSKGIDSSVITAKEGSKTYASGLERMLAMIDKLEASKFDYAMYESVEQKLYDIVKVWLAYYSNTDLLDPKYYVSAAIDDSTMSVNFSSPKAIQTENEKVDVIEKKLSLGLMDDVTALMELYNLSEEQAVERLDKIAERSLEIRMANKVIEQQEPNEVVVDGQDTEPKA